MLAFCIYGIDTIPIINLFLSGYVKRVDSWLLQGLFPQVKPLLYENGGPIIMVQVRHFKSR